MKMSAYSVFDCTVGVFARPHFLANDPTAMRSFGDAIADESTGLSKHLADYKLFRVGSFDDEAGVFEAMVTPVFICNAVDFQSLVQKKGDVKDEKNS